MTVYAALEHRFRIVCDHRGLADRVAEVFAPLTAPHTTTRPRDAAPTPAGPEGPVTTYTLRVDRRPPGPFELWCDDEALTRSPRAWRPYARLMQHVNHLANVRTAPMATVLHSAAAVGADGPVLFPAPMESGKSTLVTALVADGWPYLSDELVAMDPLSGRLRGFPRSMSLDRGSWPLFPELRPSVDENTAARLPAQWQVPPTSIGTLADDGQRPAAIVTPRYVPGAATELDVLDPVACLRRMISCCFSFVEHAERDLEVLARTIDRTPCYDLVVGDLQDARLLLGACFGPAGDPSAPIGSWDGHVHADRRDTPMTGAQR